MHHPEEDRHVKGGHGVKEAGTRGGYLWEGESSFTLCQPSSARFSSQGDRRSGQPNTRCCTHHPLTQKYLIMSADTHERPCTISMQPFSGPLLQKEGCLKPLKSISHVFLFNLTNRLNASVLSRVAAYTLSISTAKKKKMKLGWFALCLRLRLVFTLQLETFSPITAAGLHCFQLATPAPAWTCQND